MPKGLDYSMRITGEVTHINRIGEAAERAQVVGDERYS
jgi:hypothetical protein